MSVAAAIAKAAMLVALAHHPNHVVVSPGDTLWGIATSNGVSLSAVEAANPMPNFNLIYPGQRIRLVGTGATLRSDVTDGDGDHDGDKSDAVTRPRPRTDGDGDHDGDRSDHAASAPAPARAAAPAVHASGVFACVIARESGGNPHAVNPVSGAGGLFQFLPSTWHALGFSGLPEDASVATQWAAAEKQYAISGLAAWGPYDGC